MLHPFLVATLWSHPFGKRPDAKPLKIISKASDKKKITKGKL